MRLKIYTIWAFTEKLYQPLYVVAISLVPSHASLIEALRDGAEAGAWPRGTYRLVI